MNQIIFNNAHNHPPDVFLNQECISKATSNSMEPDLQTLQDDRVKFQNNLLLGYLNINSLRNKVTDLRIVFKD